MADLIVGPGAAEYVPNLNRSIHVGAWPALITLMRSRQFSYQAGMSHALK
jgi:hypothetical protein